MDNVGASPCDALMAPCTASLTDQLRAVESGLAAAWIPGVQPLRLAGPDHRDALHRVVSQDVKTLQPGQGRLAVLLAPKGHFRGLMAVFASASDVMLLAPPGRGEELAAGLGKYLAFSRSRLEPLAAAGGSLLILGPRWQEAVRGLGADGETLAAGGWCETPGDAGPVRWFGQTFLGGPGVGVAASSTDGVRRVAASLQSLGAVRVGGEAVALTRIRVGFPAWGAELTDTVLPPEVGLDDVAISYSKGCYVGQETIARLRTYGHPNRELVGLRLLGGIDASPSPPLALSVHGDERRRGELTSFGRHPDLGGVGLALVRRELAAPGTRLAGAAWTFDVASFPLW